MIQSRDEQRPFEELQFHTPSAWNAAPPPGVGGTRKHESERIIAQANDRLQIWHILDDELQHALEMIVQRRHGWGRRCS